MTERNNSTAFDGRNIAKALELLAQPAVRKKLITGLFNGQGTQYNPENGEEHELIVGKYHNSTRVNGKRYEYERYRIDVPTDIAKALGLREGSNIVLRKSE